MLDHRAPRLAVLIDADNIPARHIEAILDEIAGLGSLGLVMHQQSANTKGKNASDIGLVIDAMDILHAGKVDGFVLVSSDSDFTRLASRIREDGLQVIGIGEAKTPESLRKVCNRFVLIENIVAPSEAPAAEAKTDRAPEPAAPAKEPPSKAIPLIRDAMKKIDPDQDDYSLGHLGQVITQLHPDFDPRTYGSAKLSDLLRKTGRFELQGAGTNLRVRDKA